MAPLSEVEVRKNILFGTLSSDINGKIIVWECVVEDINAANGLLKVYFSIISI